MRGKVIIIGLLIFMGPLLTLGSAESVVYRFPLWIIAIPVGITAVLLAIAIILLKTKSLMWLAILPVLFSLLSGGLFAPMMILDRVEVTPTSIEQTTGFWWDPTRKGFTYSDVIKVQITKKRVGPKLQLHTIWEVHFLDGRVKDIEPGDLWEMNSEEIVKRLENFGVIFEQR